VTVSLKRVKMEEKLLRRAYTNLPTLFRTVSPRPPMASPSSRLWVCNLTTPFISGTGKSTDFKFVGYIYRAKPNKIPLKILVKKEYGFTYRNLHGFARFPGDSMALVFSLRHTKVHDNKLPCAYYYVASMRE